MDLYVMDATIGKESRQTSIQDSTAEKEARARVIQYMARCFYKNGIAFNVTRSNDFKLMVEAIGVYGAHLKPITYHEVRVSCLQQELEYTKNLLKKHETARAKFGCTIMSDGWTDRKGRTLINFLVNSNEGTMFVKSIDATAYTKTGDKLYELLDTFVEEIGEQNVVQLVTDNGSNYVLAGKLLTAKRPHMFWTPCAAHCLDLMLEDIGKILKVKKVIEKGISLVGYIYNHTFALNMMRKNTGNVELVRHGVTRFATSFLCLQRLHKLKAKLRNMFTSEEWLSSKGAKDAKGKKAMGIVLMPTFWNDVVYTLKVMGPIVHVMRIVDNEKQPAMGYIYAAMLEAKEAIEKSFNSNTSKFIEVFKIIDKRWECQLHHPLHAAGYYLNPKYFFSKPDIESDPKLVRGLHKCIETLCESYEVEDMVRSQLGIYTSVGGLFGLRGAIRQRGTLAPAAWWKLYGVEVPDLQLLAIKVLGLTCSASGCERNWSFFEHIHSKKRSKLEHKRLEDLVFIKYNQSLIDRFNIRDKIDPMVLNEVNYHTEWFLGEMGMGEDGEPEEELVFENDDLTWDQVANASGVNEPLIYTRSSTRQRANNLAAACASKETMAQQVEEERVEEIGEDVEDNEVEADGDYDEEDDFEDDS
ncbi:hypothetical protein P8452_40264 [Trifolium repens]|nr:hypothetical protein P8452_40264 [Trifolium repens]